MTLAHNFNGQRLVEARNARGISSVDFANIIGVSKASVSKYDNGHQKPKLELVNTMALALGFPRAYFFKPPIETDVSPIFWRGKLSAPQGMRDRAYVRLGWMKETVEYLSEFFDFPILNIPDYSVTDIDSVTDDFLENIATEMRQHFGVKSGPLPNVIEKLESNGVLISRIRVGIEKLDAFSQWSDNLKTPLVVLGLDKSSACRQRFDALHELAHLIFHRNIQNRTINTPTYYKTIEKHADKFASFMLLPERAFTEELFSVSLDGFMSLKERWGASVGSMIMRSKSLGLIDDEQAKWMFINYNRRGWRKGEPLDDKMAKEKPYLIKRSFEMLLSEGVQSQEEIKAALPFPISELEELAELNKGILGQSNIEKIEPRFKKPSNIVKFPQV